MNRLILTLTFTALLLVAGCGGDADAGRKVSAGGRPSTGSAAGHRPQRGGPAGKGRPVASVAAVPVEVATVIRQSISSFIETNGALEAENEVDVVARAAGPLISLDVEEGDRVRKDQILARLDDKEIRAQLQITQVSVDETRQAYERAKSLQEKNLISSETYDQAVSAFNTAKAQFQATKIQLGYTEIKAPFDGLIVDRYVDFAQQASAGTPLFRLSDFDPLLCPIQVPEREMLRVKSGQAAYLTVAPYPHKRFDASVLRISPVVDAATGTFKVTLEVRARQLLRPGMFARVYLETATREQVLVIPKSSLTLDSIGDAVYVVEGDKARRRPVTLGFKEGDRVEVVSGVSEKEQVVVVGQDGLSDGTPVRILVPDRAMEAPLRQRQVEDDSVRRQAPAQAGHLGLNPGGPALHGAGRPPGRHLDFSKMTPDQLDRVRQAMRERGISEKEIQERLQGTNRTPPSRGSMSRP